MSVGNAVYGGADKKWEAAWLRTIRPAGASTVAALLVHGRRKIIVGHHRLTVPARNTQSAIRSVGLLAEMV
jgi:hypothetical protein